MVVRAVDLPTELTLSLLQLEIQTQQALLVSLSVGDGVADSFVPSSSNPECPSTVVAVSDVIVSGIARLAFSADSPLTEEFERE